MRLKDHFALGVQWLRWTLGPVYQLDHFGGWHGILVPLQVQTCSNWTPHSWWKAKYMFLKARCTPFRVSYINSSINFVETWCTKHIYPCPKFLTWKSRIICQHRKRTSRSSTKQKHVYHTWYDIYIYTHLFHWNNDQQNATINFGKTENNHIYAQWGNNTPNTSMTIMEQSTSWRCISLLNMGIFQCHESC